MTDARKLALSLRDAALTLRGRDWDWWTSNSYRRLTFKGGPDTRDGGALHACVHPYDKWPDVSMAPGVQEFIELASPANVLAMAKRIEELEADSIRYRAFCNAGWPICYLGVEYRTKADLDAAIDAAMEQEKKGCGTP